MRRYAWLAVAVAAAVAGTASADIAVNWRSDGFILVNGGNSSNFPADYVGDTGGELVQLIWSDVDPSLFGAFGNTTDYLDVGGSEVLLTSFLNNVSHSGAVGGGNFDYPAEQNGGARPSFADADVGGTDITGGYLYTRVFEDATPAAGEYYFQSGVVTPSQLAANFVSPPGTGGDHVITASATVGEATLMIGVPEPSVVVLSGLGGLLILGRRIFRRRA